MNSRATKRVLVFLLVIATGGPWAFLQSVAWTGMILDYSKQASIAEAVSKTFDGKHPCRLCQQIAAGKKCEKKAETFSPLKKQDGIARLESRFLYAPLDFQMVPPTRVTMVSTPAPTPPTPPPRRLPG